MSLFQFAVIALLLELTPGPNMGYLAILAISRGRLPALIAVVGILAGLALQAILAALGAGAVIEKSPLVYEALRWVGVAYIFYLAWSGWQTEKEISPEKADLQIIAGPLLLRGFLSNVFNPKSMLFFVSVLPRFADENVYEMTFFQQMAILSAVYLSIATLVHSGIVVLAAQLRPYLVQGPHLAITRKVLSVGLALVALWLAWTTRR